MRQIAEARTAELLLDRDAEQPLRAHLGPELARKFVAAVDLIGARRDLVLREAVDAPAQHFDVFAKTEVETFPGIGDHDASSLVPRTSIVIARTKRCVRPA